MDVIGETSLLVTNEAQTFHWAGYGLKVNIPQKSLPAGVEECRVDIKAALTGQFEFPGETEVVSAVYHVQSPVKFSHPLTVEIQHCAKPTSSSSLSFVIAKRSQKELPYTFKPMKNAGVFTPHSSYGSISISEFSLLAILHWISSLLSPQSAVPVLKYYCAHVFYEKSSSAGITWKVHFVITQDLDACFSVRSIHSSNSMTLCIGTQPWYFIKIYLALYLSIYHYLFFIYFFQHQVMREQYSGMIAGVDQEVEFEDEEIILEVGDRVQDGWTIAPLAHPRVKLHACVSILCTGYDF